MQIYSGAKELKELFGIEINDKNYISRLNKFCISSNVHNKEAIFIPHNLLINWWKYVNEYSIGYDPYEEDYEFELDSLRYILHLIEYEESFNDFEEHKIFLKTLGMIDSKFKKITFLPEELIMKEKWWNCCIFKKGTRDYINKIEDYIEDIFKINLNLKDRIELLNET